MASILILSKQGDGIPIAIRLADEGHIVKVFIKENRAKTSLDGFKNPSKVNDPKKMIDQYDLIISDMVGLGDLCDELAEKGKLVLGGGSFNDKLELDRKYGEKVAKSLLKTKFPTSKVVKTTEELISSLSSATLPQVVKPFNNKASSLTLVSSDVGNRTLIGLAKQKGNELIPCLLQDKIQGIEISTEGWFNSKQWVRPFNHTMEKKRLFVGDRGPNVGCMGNVVWPTNGDKLTADVLEPMAPLLEKIGYIGPIDVNCIIDDKEAYFIEFTARLGYEAIQAFSEIIQMSLFDFLYNIASQVKTEISFHNEDAIAVRLSVPPYPNKDGVDEWKGIQVLDVPKEARKHVWFADVMKQNGLEALAGVDGVIGCVTARGGSVRECQRRAYRTVKNICISDDVQFRSDIGSDVEEKRNQLKEWSWLS